MERATKGKIIKAAALGIDVGVPFVATVSYFPVWIDRGANATVSGLSVLLVLICVVPLLRKLGSLFKSPSMPMVWTILFVLFLALESIVHEIKAICLLGMIANYIGAGMYKIGDKLIAYNEKKGESDV